MTVYLGLGANLGDRLEQLRLALELLASHGVVVVDVSPVYETKPWGFADQPDFLNAVAAIETDLAPEDFLALTQQVEREMGRTPNIKWGPREIDLDLLSWGNQQIDTPTLTLPHPRLQERAFVLAPWLDLAPEYVPPGSSMTIALHYDNLGPEAQQTVRPFGKLF